MLEVIKNLLILQDCDRRLIRLQTELESIEPERNANQLKVESAKTDLDEKRAHLNQLESRRKELELQVESKKELIAKYSLQQFQTKKNEEYKALSNEIDRCKSEIVKLEDDQILLMEQAEQAEKEVDLAAKTLSDTQQQVESQIKALQEREETLKAQIQEFEQKRDQLAANVEPSVLPRYERLLAHKGQKALVGIDHGVCGGCHMKLPVQVIFSCKAQQELITCPNCSRILYYTPEMILEQV